MSTVKSSSEDLTLNADGSGNDVLIQSNGTTKAIVTAEGYVGIGTASPSQPLHLVGGAVRFENTQDTYFQINTTDTHLYTAGSHPLRFGTNSVERGRFTETGDFQFNSGYGSVAIAYGVRAWVNFNASGTVSIRDSGNVSSVTDNGVGLFTINFTTAMPDGNYSVGSWARNNTTTAWNVTVGSLTSLSAPSTTALPIFCRDDGRTSVDPTYVTLNIVR